MRLRCVAAAALAGRPRWRPDPSARRAAAPVGAGLRLLSRPDAAGRAWAGAHARRPSPASRRMLHAVILHGRPGTPMPPWRPFLTDADSAWLVSSSDRASAHERQFRHTLRLADSWSALLLRGSPRMATTARHRRSRAGDRARHRQRADRRAPRHRARRRVDGLGDLSHASLVFSRDARYAYVFGRDGGLTKVDLLERIAERVVQAGNSIGGAISQDGRLIAVSNYEPGGVRVFDAATLEGGRHPGGLRHGKLSKVVGLVDAPGNRFVFSACTTPARSGSPT